MNLREYEIEFTRTGLVVMCTATSLLAAKTQALHYLRHSGECANPQWRELTCQSAAGPHALRPCAASFGARMRSG